MSSYKKIAIIGTAIHESIPASIPSFSLWTP